MEIKKLIMTKCMKNLLKEMEDKLQDDSNNGIRASNSGSCARKIWYEYHNYSPILLNEYNASEDKEKWINTNLKRARYFLVFDIGNKVEAQLVEIMDDKLSKTQLTCSVETPNYTITGHIDGIYKDSNGFENIVDFKSINTLGYKSIFKYRKAGTKLRVDYRYQCQAHCYMKALGINQFIFVYYDKNISAIDEAPLRFSQKVYDDVIQRFDKAIKTEAPPREYHPDDKDGWNCGYCMYSDSCYPEKHCVFDDKGKPKLVDK